MVQKHKRTSIAPRDRRLLRQSHAQLILAVVLRFSLEIIHQTIVFRKINEDGKLILINVLEYLTVIINYCAAYTVLTTENITYDPYPTILNTINNMSTQNWTLHGCTKLMLRRKISLSFCSLLIGSHMGINSEWISTGNNEIAGEISRLKTKSKSSPSVTPTLDYHSLQQRYSGLKA